MTNSILIGKMIYARLMDNDAVRQALTDTIKGIEQVKIYPIVANDDTTYPYCVYRKESITPIVCKDGTIEDQVTFSIVLIGTNYDSVCDLANTIRGLFEQITFNLKNYRIDNCKLSQIEENYVTPAFVHKLVFECKVRESTYIVQIGDTTE